jgi:hypothetical protein
MKIDGFLVGFIIFSVVVVTGFFMIGDINSNYGTNISREGFNTTYNTIDDMYNIGNEMKNKSIDAEISGGSESWDSMIKGSYSAIRLVGNTFSGLSAIVQDVATQMGIAPFYVTAAMSAITILVILSVIYLFLRFKSY